MENHTVNNPVNIVIAIEHIAILYEAVSHYKYFHLIENTEIPQERKDRYIRDCDVLLEQIREGRAEYEKRQPRSPEKLCKLEE